MFENRIDTDGGSTKYSFYKQTLLSFKNNIFTVYFISFTFLSRIFKKKSMVKEWNGYQPR